MATDVSVVHRYKEWLERRTAKFTVQGLQVSLPIGDAWAKIRVRVDDERGRDRARDDQEITSLAAKLASYREWERRSYRHDTYAAQELSEVGRRVVVIGGPGAGKTTLTRRTAHVLTTDGELVLWVRLSDVARRLRADATFDQALVQAATDGFGHVTDTLFRALMDPDCLLADGLDECAGDRRKVAEGLRDWSLARRGTRVVVTTRPIGHVPMMFEGWGHAEILPLGRDAIEEHAGRLIRAVADDEATARDQVGAFLSEIALNKGASLASRNPLLLGFLVALSRARVRLGSTRSALYGQILDLWGDRQDRERHMDPEASVADRSLDVIGWLIQVAFTCAQGGTKQDVLEGLAKHLAEDMGLLRLEARRRAEHCLNFWEQQGVIERLAVDLEEGYAFVHATLGEYTAARYVRDLDAAARRDWVSRVRRDPRWRETVLLAAGLGAIPVSLGPEDTDRSVGDGRLSCG